MPERDFKKRYEEIMRNAEKQKRDLARRARKRERLFRVPERTRRKLGKNLDSRAIDRVLARVEREIERIARRISRTSNKDERMLLKAEAAHLRELFGRLQIRRRKPPEAGIAMPAEPPKGPLPKEGGAAAPLDFDS